MPPKTAASKTRFPDVNVFLFLLGYRICNALLTRTFFQPDEYFQSLEPAWDIAFGGTSSGAWITWEWRERLRSSLHPLLFATVYRSTTLISEMLNLSPVLNAELLIVAPKLVQAGFAATMDYFVWRLAEKAYGKGSGAANAALFLTVTSPWQWFCSTRTLSNCLETALTSVALWLWPFETSTKLEGKGGEKPVLSDVGSMRAALALAAVATVLRPTNAIIWVVVALYTAISKSGYDLGKMFIVLMVECREAITSGLVVMSISVLSDRLYYDEWTFPPLRFIHFNVVQSLAIFYGRNRPDYYITEGLPLLLTTALPFAAMGLYQTFFGKSPSTPSSQKTTLPLATSVLIFTGIMSLISHKEVRFIYPLLPSLLTLSAPPFATFFSPLPWPRTLFKKTLLTLMLAVNMTLAFYISQVHQRGVIDVTHYLRHEYEKPPHLDTASNMTVMFLMPCHSTPWRSHFVYPGIDARALTCEPPIHVPVDARTTYLDEADQFYADPVAWLGEHMESTKDIGDKGGKPDIRAEKAQWPRYLVFFEQLENVMREVLVAGTGYEECWRGFNTHWHDDSRRRGDVVVWCQK